VNETFVELLQAAVETYAVMMQDPAYIITVAQAALQFARGILEHIKKQPPSSLRNSGGCF